MNQKQREFLVNHMTKIHKNKVSTLKSKLMNPPSLNNHLISAFLDGSIQLNDIDKLKEKTRQRVLKMSSNDVLIKESRDNWQKSTVTNRIEISAEDLFIMPESFNDELAKVRAHNQKIKEEIDSLEGILNTIIMKIQIGTDKHLAPLIEDVENIGDLRLVNQQLLLKS